MPNKLQKLLHLTMLCLCAMAVVCIGGCGHTSQNSKQAKNEAPQKFHNRKQRSNEVVTVAKSLLETNYKRGGNHPKTGMDCSGFVRYVFKEAWGTNLPRTSNDMSKIGISVKARELEPGDLVFYNTRRRKFSHVGIYVGEGKFIHSPSPGGQVRIENMSMVYWKKRFNGARRVKDPRK